MKLYEKLNNVPVSNWNNIQQSFIDEKPDLTYLIEKPTSNSSNYTKRKYEKLISKIRGSKKYNKKLYLKYLELLYQMPEVDVSLNKKYAILKYKLLQYNFNIEINLHRKLVSYSKINNKKYDVEKSFNEYLIELNNSYEDFEYKFNYVIEDYDQEWKRIFKKEVPKQLKDQMEKSGMGFFLWEEYFFQINKWNLDLRLIMSTKRFHEIFIKQKTLKVKDLEAVNKRLLEAFKKNKQFEKWFLIRFDFFDMKKLKFRAKKQQTILTEVIGLSKILEQNIDIDKVTIGDLQNNYRKQAELIIEANKPKK